MQLLDGSSYRNALRARVVVVTGLQAMLRPKFSAVSVRVGMKQPFAVAHCTDGEWNQSRIFS
jgi:hypothetical protein